jgi:hypothetical protein
MITEIKQINVLQEEDKINSDNFNKLVRGFTEKILYIYKRYL